MSHHKGNVLFLILLAVALFAALSYAVTQSSRSGGKNISDEQAELIASQHRQYVTAIESAITRLKLTNNCRNEEISVAADSDGDGNWFDTNDTYHNANSPTDFSCHVFHPNGGNIPWTEDSLEDFTGSHAWQVTYSFYSGEPTLGAGLDGLNDLGVYVQVSEKVCNAFNKKINITSIPATTWRGNYYNGDFESHNGPAVNVSGKTSFCFEFRNDEGVDTGTYFIRHIIIPR